MYAGAGTDTLTGGMGDDVYYLSYLDEDLVNDTIVEKVNEGTDTAWSLFSVDRLADNVENLYLIRSSNIDANGNNLDNAIYGNGGNNSINGGTGNDTLSGGAGNDFLRDYGGDNDTFIGGDGNDDMYAGGGIDTLTGGAGDDRYYLSYLAEDLVNDTIVESANEGIDTALSVFSVDRLADNVENLYLIRSSNIDANGNNLDNAIYGNSGNNIINGGGGNDTLYGGNGNDTFAFGGTNLISVSAMGIDTIADFSSGEQIQLNKLAFATLLTSPIGAAVNPLLASDFSTVTTDAAAETATTAIVYNSLDGKLFYNADLAIAGFGATGGQFAQLNAGLVLTANDFSVIGNSSNLLT
jgi:Ca2+-binding RTX toxin-like protein